MLEYAWIEYKHNSTKKLFKNQRVEQSLKPGVMSQESAQGYGNHNPSVLTHKYLFMQMSK